MMETDFDAELGVPTQFGVKGHEYVRAQPPSRPPLASIAVLDFLSPCAIASDGEAFAFRAWQQARVSMLGGCRVVEGCCGVAADAHKAC